MNEEAIISQWNIDEHGNPISVKTEQETQVSVGGNLVQLEGVPDEMQGVTIEDKSGNVFFRVENLDEVYDSDYAYYLMKDGRVKFNPSQNGKLLYFKYYSKGVTLLSISRIYYKDSYDNVVKILEDLIKAGFDALKVLEVFGGAKEVIDRLERDLDNGRALATQLEDVIAEGKPLQENLNADITEAKKWKDSLHKDVAEGKILQPQLHQDIIDGRETDANLTQTINSATELDDKIKTTGNASFIIEVENWIASDDSDWAYMYSLTTSLNSSDLVFKTQEITTKGFEDCLLYSIVKDSNTIAFYTDDKVRTKVIINARQYGGTIQDFSVVNTDLISEGASNKYVTPQEKVNIGTIPDIKQQCELNKSSLEERVKYYLNYSDMVSDDSLKNGQSIRLFGYYYPNDGGQCDYIYENGEFKPVVLNCVTPEMFGARGDGITDDTEAIQKAFDSDLSNIVIFGRKTYIVSSQLNINKSKLIMGAGYTYTPNRSTILKCTQDCIKINVSYVNIKYIYLQGNSDSKPSYQYLAITVKDELSKAIAQITLEDIFIAYFDEACRTNGYSWNYNNVNINNVNKGFNILGGTAHRFNACSVNLCKTGFETTDVIYSTLLNCSVDHTTERAYYIHGASRNISLLGCSGENISKTLLDIDSAFYVNVENLQSLFNNTTSGETLIKLTSSSYCKLSQINLTGYNSIQGNILMINLGGNNIIENCEWLGSIEKIKIIQSTVLGRNDIRLPINTSIERGEFAIESNNKVYCENVLPLLQNSESKKSIGIKLTGLNSAMPLESKLENINGFNNVRIWASSSTKEQNIYDIKNTGVTISGNGSTIKFQNMIFKSLSELPTNGFSISDSKVIFINCDFSQLSVSGGKKITCANFANVIFNGCQGITISSDVKKDGTCDVLEKNA